MKLKLPNKLNYTVEQILRKAGYLYIFDNISQQGSFVRELAGERYPRFHMYVKESPEKIIFDLHLDQSVTRYKGQSAHNADYASAQVKAELIRIAHIVDSRKI